MNVGFPFRVDSQGRLASPGYVVHVRQLIEQLLFTDPGSRVNRPDLGAGLLELIFAPASDEVVAVTEHQVSASLTRWLGEIIQVAGVTVRADDNELTVTVVYSLRRTREQVTEVFVRRRDTDRRSLEGIL